MVMRNIIVIFFCGRRKQVGGGLALLNAQDHQQYLSKHKEDPSLYRPDIVHQALMAILDSPLNKAGKIKGVYIHTTDNYIVFVSPSARIPRMFKRFCGLIVEVLQRMSVKSSQSGQKLLKLVRGPITDHFPAGTRQLAFSHSVSNVTDFYGLLKKSKIRKTTPLALVIGAMAHGNVLDMGDGNPYSFERELCISSYPLSAACAVNRVLGALERWLLIL
ncbi:hypothetical protein AAMO2058_001138500 [Amorphochlora amoebiformis]